MYTIVGLGNPGKEYEHTRHNAGRMMLESIRTASDASEWKLDKKLNALVCKGELAGKKITLVAPETFMNKSGSAVAPLVKTKKAAETAAIYQKLT